jgi:hypothetical protein
MKSKSTSLKNASRRDFLITGAALGTAFTTLSPSSNKPDKPSKEKMIGIQVPVISFLDEGVDQLLDILQEKGNVNTIFLATFTFSRGTGGRQIPGHPLPDHGKREYDLNWHGGNFATPHPQYYAGTILGGLKAPDYGNLDILDLVLPKTKKRGMKVYCWLYDSEEWPGSIPNLQKVAEVDLYGRRSGFLCQLRPDYRNFVIGLTEDMCKSYEIEGIMWGSERNGPLLNATGSSHYAIIEPSKVTCFCKYHRKAAEERGIDVDRAREGYTRLAQFIRQSEAGQRPSDGYFVEFLRLLLEYPEIVSWEKLMVWSKLQIYGDIYGTAKGSREGAGHGRTASNIQVGYHIAHVNSWNPLFRAERTYEELGRTADFLKVVMYNNCGGPRYAHFINNLSGTMFKDVPPDELMRFWDYILNYRHEAPYNEISTAGLSPDYVSVETQRALQGAKGLCSIYPGIDVDIPTGKGQKKTAPDDVYKATLAALKTGTDGIIFSRKYSEMRLENLAAGGRAVKEYLG